MNTIQAIDLIKTKAQQMCPGWELDSDNTQVVTAMAAWLAREGRQGMDMAKGLLIVGNVGTGKTMLLRALRGAMLDAYGAQFGMRSCSELVRSFTDEGYDAIDPWMNAPHVCFDDLGTEGEAVHYGKKTNLMAEMIEARYERLASGRKCWTHLTTNLGTDKIAERYGSRAASRLRQMCNVLDLGASSAARDRRATAAGISQPVEQQNPDNIYQVVHPTIAARLQQALKPAIESARAITVPKLEIVGKNPTQADHLAQFAAGIADLDDEQLEHVRNRIRDANSPDAAAPFMRAVDAELARRTAQGIAKEEEKQTA